MDCHQESKSVDGRRVWAYEKNVEEKTTAFWKEYYDRIRSGECDGDETVGIKGPSLLYDMGIDPYAQNALDFMHQVYEGVLHRILDSLFGKLKL